MLNYLNNFGQFKYMMIVENEVELEGGESARDGSD